MEESTTAALQANTITSFNTKQEETEQHVVEKKSV